MPDVFKLLETFNSIFLKFSSNIEFKEFFNDGYYNNSNNIYDDLFDYYYYYYY